MFKAELEQLTQQRSGYSFTPENPHNYLETLHVQDHYRERVLNPFFKTIGNHKEPVLDIASGIGEFAHYAARQRITVVQMELNLQASLYAGEGARVCADMNDEFPFSDASFGAIHSKDALIHVGDKAKFFFESARILKLGGHGIFVFQTWDIDGASLFYHGLGEKSAELHEIEYQTRDGIQSSRGVLMADPAVDFVGPAYYRTKPREVMWEMREAGFDICDSYLWMPPVDEPDWHDQGEIRTVVLVQKR